MIFREKENPVLGKEDFPVLHEGFENIGAFNAGAALCGGETVLLVRVAERPVQRDGRIACPVFDPGSGRTEVVEFSPGELDGDGDPRILTVGGKRYLTSISHLHVARSRDGVHFRADPEPLLQPRSEYESFGIEDARISCVEGRYYITYSAASPLGCVVGLAVTDDFVTVQRAGNLFHPDNKDTVLFDRKIGGKYYALHRPSCSCFTKPAVWLAESPDLRCFGMHRFVAGVRPGRWDGARVGAGAPPFLTEKGWVELYHGATEDDRYCMGAMLLDRDEPWRVLARSGEPLVEPEYPYEKKGFFGNVIFGCGLTLEGNTVRLYYGASDESVAMLSMTVQDIFDHLGV